MLRICPPQPRRDISAPNSRPGQGRGQGMEAEDFFDPFDGCLQNVAERESSGVIDQDIDFTAESLYPLEKFVCGFGSCQVDRDDLYRQSVLFVEFFGCGFQFRRIESCEDQPVSEFGQPPGHAAPDAAAGTRHQSGPAPFFDRSLACHYGSFASSSRIFRGRSPQCLQHFISTEYMRAMQ